MSTFDGIVEEFPQIRIDYFRKNPDRPAPLACFLSHVHSDHLQGLESLRAPFIYCSAATREILLRLEKYPHRINFSKGILESRKKHYKHLSKLLRPIPLQVPTEIELSPRNNVRVTLFDANHCPGAVMFLIEGNRKAILYTGDIRAESWWVDNLIRHPVLIPYTLGSKRLDKIYLDTTFATKSNVYQSFPSKAEGIRELLEKIQTYPDSTLFYLRVWTFGYEDVWLALSAALNTRIHVDEYQMGVYRSLTTRVTNGFGVDEAPFLCGFQLGNTQIPGCLTVDHGARIHSCEPGMVCSSISKGPSVYITPIVSRMDDGSEIPELGAGGGQGDLYQSHELELQDDFAFQQLLNVCSERIQDEEIRASIIAALSEARNSNSKSLSLDAYGIKEDDEISVQQLVSILSRGPPAENLSNPSAANLPKFGQGQPGRNLPNTIRFPYSRHSSYAELCNFVKAFKPQDIFPCTVDPATWNEDVSMCTLFGHLCSGANFAHDELMRRTIKQAEHRPQKRRRIRSDSSSSINSTQQSDSDILLIQETELPPVIPIAAIHESKHDSNSDRLPELQIQEADLCPAAARRVCQQTSQNINLESRNDMTSQMSSVNSQLIAIKHALKEKHLNHELEFHLPSSLSDFGTEIDDSSQRTSNAQAQAQAQSQSQNLSTSLSLHFSQQHTTQGGNNSQTSTGANNNNRNYNDDDDDDSQADSPETHLSLFQSAFDLEQTTTADSSTTSERRKRRIAAYRAARVGTYEAWSSIHSLVSAGNNHTEEEVEL
ncbi:DNA repair protein [Blastomyces dermatitidis ER-3]|uniref:Protein artemis n=3 Tax=Blastomyces TaxID=229219 RepID=A0A179URG5_BLAGS|nr:DNA repair protein [Blastomyces gilchristii SLH14081]XP_045275026.1 DNA repair protein [Blastomyces dermatitidis ER-3]EEQ87763.2 DNA repair protein [Blastomyces dermatitidis ER-3]EGE79165.2 DNA repair protein [Blastomyces dermatitidis ATCC 18188]OAT09621.1 DNA repair protein [Blastomyces gilchristii SLH14081]